MKKILLVSFEFPPTVGGAGSVAYDYADYLREQNYQLSIITSYNKNRKEDEVHNIYSVKSPRKIQTIFLFIKFLRVYNSSYDNIILNDAGSCLMALLFFSDNLKKKCIVFLHGSEDRKLLNNNGIFFRLLNISNRYSNLLKKCKSIICVSKFLKKKFLKKTGLTLMEDKFVVIRNSIYNSVIPDVKEMPLNLRHPGKTIFFSASRLVEKKGFENMIKIFKEVVSVNKNFLWLIAGEGQFRKKIVELIISYGLTKNIKLIGEITKKEIWSYYYFSDCFWQLSDFEEGLGLVYLEASLCGCPVIGFNEGGIPEVITEKTGFLFDRNADIKGFILSKKYNNLDKLEIIKEANKINIDNRYLLINQL